MISKVRKHPKFNNYRPAECIKADVCNMIINGKEDEFFLITVFGFVYSITAFLFTKLKCFLKKY